MACALEILGHLGRLGGKPARAQERFEEALRVFRETADAARVGSCLHGLAEVSLARGDLAAALHALRDAVSWLEEAEDPELAERVVIGLGRVHSARQELPEAERAFSEALRRAETRGAHRTAIEALMGLGHLRRARGDLQAATDTYRRACELAPSALSARSMRCRLQLGLALLAQQAWSEVVDEIAPWVEALEERGRSGLLAFARVVLFAARLDSASVPAMTEALHRSRLVDADVAWALELAGARAAAGGDAALAIAVWTLARVQYLDLRQPASAERVSGAMATLSAVGSAPSG